MCFLKVSFFKMSFWFHCLDKNTNKIISGFLSWVFFVASWGLHGSFLGLPAGFLAYDITYQVPGSPKSFHDAPRKLQKNSGQKSRNNFVGIFVQTMKPKRHFQINWPLAYLVLNQFQQKIVKTFGSNQFTYKIIAKKMNRK